MQLHTNIDETLINEARQLSGLQSDQEILEIALRTWLDFQHQQQRANAYFAELRRQKVCYQNRVPLSIVEPAGSESLYKGKTLSLADMQVAIRKAAEQHQ